MSVCDLVPPQGFYSIPLNRGLGDLGIGGSGDKGIGGLETWDIRGFGDRAPDKFKPFKPYLKTIQILADNLG